MKTEHREFRATFLFLIDEINYTKSVIPPALPVHKHFRAIMTFLLINAIIYNQ